MTKNVSLQNRLSSGYTYLYMLIISNGEQKFHFLGLVDQFASSTIYCLSAEDLEYRYNTLRESNFYLAGNYEKHLDQLNKLAQSRVNKCDFIAYVEKKEVAA